MIVRSVVVALVVVVSDVPADDQPQAVVDGHTIVLDHCLLTQSRMPPPAGMKRSSTTWIELVFTYRPRDATRIYAFEVGRALVVKDTDGKEIPITYVLPEYLAAEYHVGPYGRVEELKEWMGTYSQPTTIRVGLLRENLRKIGSIAGDLYVAEGEAPVLKFTRAELAMPGAEKADGATTAKLTMFDEHERGSDVRFTVRRPNANEAKTLAGPRIPSNYFVYAIGDGRPTLVAATKVFGDGPRLLPGEASPSFPVEFPNVKIPADAREVHLVCPRLDYPRRLPFVLKEVTVAERPGVKARRPAKKPPAPQPGTQ